MGGCHQCIGSCQADTIEDPNLAMSAACGQEIGRGTGHTPPGCINNQDSLLPKHPDLTTAFSGYGVPAKGGVGL